ncbi:MAG: M28 family peptidase [Acidobacteria bacterium]|nr:M28 family peptidase [Acidobacteriota bacterium]
MFSARAQSKAKSKKAATAVPTSYGNADAITQDELKAYLYFLASDQLEGRNLPSRGYDIAALYVASHLAEWGLKPGGSTTGTNGPLQPYFLPMEMVAREIVPAGSKLTLHGPAPAAGRGGFGGGFGGEAGAGRGGQVRATPFEYGREWTAGTPGGFGRGAAPQALDVSGKLVFAGNGYVINKTKTDPYAGLDVKGKIVVVAGLPAELAAQQAAGRGARGGVNPLGEACKDYLTPEQYAARNGALAVVAVANFQQLAAMAPGAGGRGGRGAGLNGPNFQVAKFMTAGTCPAAPLITAGLELTNALFQGEKLSGSQVFYGAGGNTKLDSFDLAANKTLDLKIAVKTENGHAEDVVGIIEGSDPVLKDEYVVLSAHLDHLGLSAPAPDGHNVNNGADDDGSGSVGLLAIAHAYADGVAKGIRPKRSILFLWNGGEEKGLWGSQYFTQFPPIDLAKVVANLNMDMIGRTKNEKSVDPNQTHVLVNPGEVLLVGPDVSSSDLEEIIEAVNNNYQKLKLNHFYDTTAPDATHDNLGPQPRGQRIFYRSDHYNFAKMGIPIAFFTTGLHVDYHRPTDTPEKIDYQEMQSVSRTVAAITWQLANSSGRPKLKEKLPEDLVKDMKTAREAGWGRITPVQAPLPGVPYE